ncbi:hypothetical protein DICVIV_07398 [Dictyocaulus viviparus]|uniref:Uncharacterized protein n=1 Tax=Dictyocaulus viviparus TaxID=29172 RepID=A0A0D8XPQ9_DICVI|nr:hypothetical protein DICVIV_07398 [Dictyocaulus viviparus]
MVGLPPLIPDLNNDKICNEYLDGYSYHLTDFAKMGYKTMVAQDYGPSIAYYPNCIGFNKSEADHIWRPFEIRMGESTIFKKAFIDSCSELHIEMLDYLQKFMNAYSDNEVEFSSGRLALQSRKCYSKRYGIICPKYLMDIVREQWKSFVFVLH